MRRVISGRGSRLLAFLFALGRASSDFDVQNWWMGMASRPAAGGTIQFNAMFSLERQRA